MASLIAFTIFQVLALLRYNDEVSWTGLSAWLYVLTLILLGFIGLHELLRSRHTTGHAG